MATPLFRVTVKAEGAKEFQRVLNEYAKWNKRQPMEVATAKAYFIDLQAMKATKAVTKEEIAQKLNSPSKTYPNVSLAPILINKQLGKQHKKGLTGAAMAAAVEKYIKFHQNRTQFARSGWIGGLKTLDFWKKKGDVQFSKKFAPKKPQGVKQIGNIKGWAQVTNRDGFCSVTVANEVGKGKQASATIDEVLEAGLERGFAVETTSMISYINRKYEEQFNKMKRINTFN